MAESRSFSFDRRGRITSVGGAAERLIGDAVGQPAADAIRLLLDASGADGAPVLQFDAWRNDGETEISVIGAATTQGAARAQSAYVASTFERAVAGIELYDRELRVLRANPSALAIRDAEPAEVLDHGADALDRTLPLSPLLGEVMDPDRAGGAHPVIERDIRKGPHVYSVLALPLLDGDRVIGAAAIIHDVTESERVRKAGQLLAATHEKVGQTLGVMRTAQELAAVAVEDFADIATVDLVDAVFQGDEPPFPPVRNTTMLRRAAVEAVTEFSSLYEVGEPSHFVFPTPYTQALSDLEPRLVDPQTGPTDWQLHDSARSGILRQAGVHSMILAPIVEHGRALGLLCLYRNRRKTTRFDRRDLALAEQVAARGAINIENARRYVRERTTATTLQRQLLPQHIPQVPAVRTAHFWKPGGNKTHWYDVIALSGARVGLVLGRIPQHGLRASADMGRFRTAFTTLARMDLPPDELLAHLDDITHEMQQDDAQAAAAAPETDGTRCLYAIYDSITGQCAIASAGWPAPLVTAPDGATRPLDMPVGPALGRHSNYEAVRTTLEPRALLTCYSGSMLRAARGDDAFAQLRRAAAQSAGDAQAACDNIVYALMGDPARRRSGGAVLTTVVSRLGDDNHVSWTAPRDRAAVADCRARARAQLDDWGLGDLAFATEVVVSELVTNVLTHARGNPRLRMIRDDRLTIEVSDNSSTSPHLRHARTQDENGRGLLIATTLASRWGTRYGEDGKTIWVEQDLTPAEER